MAEYIERGTAVANLTALEVTNPSATLWRKIRFATTAERRMKYEVPELWF